MAKALISVRSRFAKNLVSRLSEGKTVLRKPLAGPRGIETAKIMRLGERGIKAQFVAQSEFQDSRSTPWKKTKAFGTKKAPRKTMLGTGDYRAAWLGGAGSVVTVKDNAVTVGVDRGLHPQVAIHQSASPFTKIYPKKKIRSGAHKGEWKMRFFLGLTYGVWLSNERLALGLKIPRRRLGISREVKREVAALVSRDVRAKFKPSSLGLAK